MNLPTISFWLLFLFPIHALSSSKLSRIHYPNFEALSNLKISYFMSLHSFLSFTSAHMMTKAKEGFIYLKSHVQLDLACDPIGPKSIQHLPVMFLNVSLLYWKPTYV